MARRRALTGYRPGQRYGDVMSRSLVFPILAVAAVTLAGCASEPTQEESDDWFASISERPPMSDTDFGTGAQVGAEPNGASFDWTEEPTDIAVIRAACLGDGHRATIAWEITTDAEADGPTGASEEVECTGDFVDLSSTADGMADVAGISVMMSSDGEQIPVAFSVLVD